MEWTDEALVLGARKHGENSVILEVMTHHHGRHLGLVRNGRSRKFQAALQPGNSVTVTWRARLEDHLGQFSVELHKARAAVLMADPVSVYGVQFLAGLLRLLPERTREDGLYLAASAIVETFEEPLLAAGLLVRLELAVLEELGFGLDLESCAATGGTQELVYVSPKSGRAVSRKAGLPYHDKLLTLPRFLVSSLPRETPDAGEVFDGFRLAGFFYDRHIWGARGIQPPGERDGFITALKKQMSG
ncbi:DNA repair protein RecO [Coralliovum pocilloporae]|uniref:DNA repair protein RecO n=1 Tax=Coralliovum pocilloporae TaxID=3066369 RepID=UPI003307B38E